MKKHDIKTQLLRMNQTQLYLVYQEIESNQYKGNFLKLLDSHASTWEEIDFEYLQQNFIDTFDDETNIEFLFVLAEAILKVNGHI